MKKVPETVWLAAALGVAIGGWMLYDAIYALRDGDYHRIDGQLGPWTVLTNAAGLEPLEVAPGFVGLGLLWLIAAGGLIAGLRWGWWAGVTLAAVSFAYCCIGTAFALVALVLLLLPRSRRAFAESRGRPNMNRPEPEGGD